MREVENLVTPFIESQLPGFYQEEGPLFILFLKEYYNWLNTKTYLVNGNNVAGGALYHSRSLPNYRDIDRTVEDYIVYFKEKYLKGVNFDSESNRRTLVKASQDLFKSKGSATSIELLFNLVYGISINIYTPSKDIIRCSNATWKVPKYLEVIPSPRSASLAGKQVTGTKSGAKAFVEYVITRNVNGKFVDVLFVSNVIGDFLVDDIVTDDGIVEDAPVVYGSFNSIDITQSGSGFTQGEEVTIISASGVEGRAFVTNVVSETGLVDFQLVDGGWGYSTSANVLISEKVLIVNNKTNSDPDTTDFEKYEMVTQTNYKLDMSNMSGNFTVGMNLRNPANATAIVVYNTQPAGSNTANVVITPGSGNIFSNSILYAANLSLVYVVNTVNFTKGTFVVQSNGTSNTGRGYINDISNVNIFTINTSSISANGIHVGDYILQSTTNAKGKVLAIPREAFHVYDNVASIAVSHISGTFSNTNTLNIYEDIENTTFISVADPLSVANGYEFELTRTSGTSRWSTSNTIMQEGYPATNNIIVLASDVGGKYTTNVDVSATATVIGVNATAIGLYNISNTFYAANTNRIRGTTSNTYANCVQLSTGSGASFTVGSISDAETVLASPDTISGNNDGPGSNSISFATMRISGVNSGYGNASAVTILSGGSGYNNTDIVTFTGGNTGVGSYGIGNASILTNASGVITEVTLSANLGNLIVTAPSVSITNSGGGTSTGSGANVIPIFNLGFPENVFGNIEYPLIELLRFETMTIGTITSLASVNPGENYNIAPFISIDEPYISSYGERDIILEVDLVPSSVPFAPGEIIVQTSNSTGVELTSNNYSGGNTSASYVVNETVTMSDGITTAATGRIYSTTKDGTNTYTTVVVSTTGTFAPTENVRRLRVTANGGFTTGETVTQTGAPGATGVVAASNSTHIVVIPATGTFVANSTLITGSSSSATILSVSGIFKINRLYGTTSRGFTDITNVGTGTTSITARGRVKTGSTLSTLLVERINLFTEFVPGQNITGLTNDAQANVISVAVDIDSHPVGLNANVTANVVTTDGAVGGLSLISSGLSFIDDQTATFTSTDGLRSGTGKINLGGVGTGAGYYSNTNGILDDNNYIHDGEYYQEYSYEVQSTKPLSVYSDLLKQLLHTSGTKLFGKVSTSTVNDINVAVAQSTVTIS